ncbi:MAG: DUF2892 domain-containing protein [Novosphingobium sp.]
MFVQNVGGIDRFARILIGIVLIALVFVGPKTPWGWLGLIPLVTGIFRTCPLYRLFGLNTCWKGPYN